MPTLTLLASSPHSALYSVRFDPAAFPPPTPRFRSHALSCGLYFLNSLTWGSFVREVRAAYAPSN